jgi:glycosyltransferase involved in cell wall biosynthesis
VIIPAYNEAPRVGSVVAVAASSGIFAEVVVIDDGSTDSTADASRAAGARVVEHGANRGKGQAMRTGLSATSSPVVCFLDADLIRVTRDHLAALVGPVARGEVGATLAVFAGGRWATSLAQRIAPLISGQRCLRRDLVEDFLDWPGRFGIETALNDHLRRQGVSHRLVRWQGAAQVMKEEKRGALVGFLARLAMYWQILLAWLRTKHSPK